MVDELLEELCYGWVHIGFISVDRSILLVQLKDSSGEKGKRSVEMCVTHLGC